MSTRRAITIYSLLFVLLAAADLGSSVMGHRLASATEFNPAMAVEGRISIMRFVGLNALLGVVTIGMFGWALASARHADPAYVAAPWKAALSWLGYANPFSERNRPKAVFHWIAIPVSLLMVRTFAIANNLAISFDLPDVLTPLTGAASQWVRAALVYPLVVTVVVAPFWLSSLYVVSSITRRIRPDAVLASLASGPNEAGIGGGHSGAQSPIT